MWHYSNPARSTSLKDLEIAMRMNNVEEIGNDIEERFTGVACPTLKIKSLAVSGK